MAEGRRVIHNIERSASLFLVKNVFSFILSLISLISVSLYPLKPAQISLTSVILVEWSLLFADAFRIPAELASTVAFFLYAVAACLMLFRVRKPMTVWHGILFGAMGVLLLSAVFLVPEWFHIAPLDYGCSLILSALLLLSFPIDRVLQRGFLWMESRVSGGKRTARRKTRKEGSSC